MVDISEISSYSILYMIWNKLEQIRTLGFLLFTVIKWNEKIIKYNYEQIVSYRLLHKG